MFRLIKEILLALLSFSGSLARVAKDSNRTKFIYLNNKPRITKPTLTDSNPDEHNEDCVTTHLWLF